MEKNFLESDVIWLDTVDSTNEEIKRRSQKILKTTWVIAKSQYNGKGRNGKKWLGGKENFFGSVILFPDIDRSKYHFYGFIFGVALYNTVKEILGNKADIRLKWPNDLLIEGRKVAGILLESVQIPHKSINGVIVGMGVNLNSLPNLNVASERDYDVQCIKTFINERIDILSFFKSFSKQLIDLETNLGSKGLKFVLDLWQERTFEKGTKVRVTDQNNEVRAGEFLGLDEIGGLIVMSSSGKKGVYSGDVYFGS